MKRYSSDTLFLFLCGNKMLGNLGARKPKSQRTSFCSPTSIMRVEKQMLAIKVQYLCDVYDDESLETNHVVSCKNFKIQFLFAVITSHFYI
jgi:hypothetical protein